MLPTDPLAVELSGPFCPGWPEHGPDCLCDLVVRGTLGEDCPEEAHDPGAGR